jgi:hypothetical protein
MPDLKEGMSLREFIEELREIAKTEGDQIEVVSFAEDGTPFTPVVGVGACKRDGIRRVSV